MNPGASGDGQDSLSEGLIFGQPPGQRAQTPDAGLDVGAVVRLGLAAQIGFQREAVEVQQIRGEVFIISGQDVDDAAQTAFPQTRDEFLDDVFTAVLVDQTHLPAGRPVLLDRDVRVDARFVNAAAAGQVVLGHGQAQLRVTPGRVERENGLDGALAEGSLADERGAAVVLKRAGNDFAGRRRASVDEHDHLPIRVRGRFQRAKILAAGGFAALRIDDQLPAVQEQVRDVDRRREQAAGVIGQIQYQAPHALPFQIIQSPVQILGCPFAEARQPHVPHPTRQHAGVDAVHLDEFADNRELLKIGPAAPVDLDLYTRAGLAFQIADDLFELEVNGLPAVHFDYLVETLEADLIGGAAVNGRDHREYVVAHVDPRADPTVHAGDLHPHRLDGVFVQVAAERIQAADHGVGGGGDHLLDVGGFVLVYVFLPNSLQDLVQQLQIVAGLAVVAQDQLRPRALRRRIAVDPQQMLPDQVQLAVFGQDQCRFVGRHGIGVQSQPSEPPDVDLAAREFP